MLCNYKNAFCLLSSFYGLRAFVCACVCERSFSRGGARGKKTRWYVPIWYICKRDRRCRRATRFSASANAKHLIHGAKVLTGLQRERGIITIESREYVVCVVERERASFTVKTRVEWEGGE